MNPITKPEASKAPHVVQAINAVTAALASEGISKSRNNSQQGYKFRGIDEVLNALARAISDAKLVIVPHVDTRELTERQSKSGGVLFSVVVRVNYTFLSAVDGSQLAVGPFDGEAMDSADKATNKAMSAAYKYMAIQTFCIPTEGDNDADAATHEVAPTPQKIKDEKTGRMVNPNSAHHLRKNGAWDSFVDRIQGFEEATDLEGLKAWFASDDVAGRVAAWPKDWRELADAEFEAAHDRIAKRRAPRPWRARCHG